MTNFLDIPTTNHVRPHVIDIHSAECGLCEIREPSGKCGISLISRGGNHGCDYGLSRQETHDLANDPEKMRIFISKP